jgi:hypothetical protein
VRYWFQNLNEKKHKLFYFRGSISSSDNNKKYLKYEFSSGRSLKLKYSYGDDGPQWTLGLLFFTVYLTSPIFRVPSISTGRDYGFYFYEWAFVWSWHARQFEHNSSDQWWMHQYFRIDDFFLGKPESLIDELGKEENIWFKIGDKEFKMDSIKWTRGRSFRRHIPYSLFHKTWYSVNMEIEKPPMHSGKGENSWDCGDDGCFGLSAPWNFEPPKWSTTKESAKLAVQYYVEHVLKDAKRYGVSSGERGIRADLAWEYIGRKDAK